MILRGFVGGGLIANLDADPDAYRAIAQSIDQAGVYGLIDSQGIARPTAFRPPLYPGLLSCLTPQGEHFPLLVVFFHALLGGITVLFAFLTTKRFLPFCTDRVPVIAALLVLIDPILVHQSTLLMTETLATALSAAILWWCASCKWLNPASPSSAATLGKTCADALILGLLLSLAYLCRPTFLVWAGLLIGALAIRTLVRRGKKKRTSPLSSQIPSLVLVGSIVAMTVGGWAIRNSRSIGHPVWATTHGGYTLLLANNPMFYDYLRQGKWGDVWNPDSFFEAYQNRYRGDFSSEAFWQTDWKQTPQVFSGQATVPPTTEALTTEIHDDRRVHAAAKATILRQKNMFAYASLVRLGRLWSPLPHSVVGRPAWANLAVGVYYLAVFSAAFIGSWRIRHRWREPFLLASITLVLTLSAVHSVYWSNLRMRAPVTPVIALLAATAVGFRKSSTNLAIKQEEVARE